MARERRCSILASVGEGRICVSRRARHVASPLKLDGTLHAWLIVDEKNKADTNTEKRSVERPFTRVFK